MTITLAQTEDVLKYNLLFGHIVFSPKNKHYILFYEFEGWNSYG
jgi:hypothetical protein